MMGNNMFLLLGWVREDYWGKVRRNSVSYYEWLIIVIVNQ
jgi:hypothetical protein